jgi:hypothetical protein
MGTPLDDRRLRVRQTARAIRTEQSSELDAGSLPVEVSWRYRRDGFPRAFALFGVVIGCVALILPGLVALRSYLAWQRGAQAEPTLPWSLAILGLLAIPLVPLFTVLPVVAVGLAILLGLPLLVMVGPRH